MWFRLAVIVVLVAILIIISKKNSGYPPTKTRAVPNITSSPPSTNKALVGCKEGATFKDGKCYDNRYKNDPNDVPTWGICPPGYYVDDNNPPKNSTTPCIPAPKTSKVLCYSNEVYDPTTNTCRSCPKGGNYDLNSHTCPKIKNKYTQEPADSPADCKQLQGMATTQQYALVNGACYLQNKPK